MLIWSNLFPKLYEEEKNHRNDKQIKWATLSYTMHKEGYITYISKETYIYDMYDIPTTW